MIERKDIFDCSFQISCNTKQYICKCTAFGHGKFRPVKHIICSFGMTCKDTVDFVFVLSLRTVCIGRFETWLKLVK